MPQTIHRLTVVESVYYQTVNGDAREVRSAFERVLHTGEQLWQRSLQIGSGWVEVDFGWLDAGSALCVQNKSAVIGMEIGIKIEPVVTSEDAPADALFKVALPTPFSKIAPKASVRIDPVADQKYYIRAVTNEKTKVPCDIVVVPL